RRRPILTAPTVIGRQSIKLPDRQELEANVVGDPPPQRGLLPEQPVGQRLACEDGRAGAAGCSFERSRGLGRKLPVIPRRRCGPESERDREQGKRGESADRPGESL